MEERWSNVGYLSEVQVMQVKRLSSTKFEKSCSRIALS